MQASLAFQHLVKECVYPVLKREGFSKRGNTFFLRQKENWGLINFQKSLENTKDEVIFTVNLGIASTKLLKYFQRDKRPAIYDCHWLERLGFYLPQHKDVWWIINSSTSVKELCEEMRKHICELAVPEIKKYIGDENLRDLWLSGKSPGLTELQRLRNLSVLLEFLGPQELLPPVLEELQAI